MVLSSVYDTCCLVKVSHLCCIELSVSSVDDFVWLMLFMENCSN